MANLKSTTINDTGFLQLPSGTTAERPASPTAGEIRFNTDTKVTEWYDSELDSWFPTGVVPLVATGGDTVEDVDIDGVTYRIHSFTTVGESTFTVTRGGLVEFLIVAGGGAGATTDGGGGGGGGVLLGQQNVKTGTQLIAVGAGGNFIDSNDTAGENGFNSYAFGLTAIGGGGGGNDRASGEQSKSGGSGGGGGSDQTNTNGGLDQFQGSAGTPGQGNSGGLGVGDTQNITRRSGGGGGAGSPGQPGNGSPNGAGGTGIFVGNIFSLSIGESGFVAGGGGGGHNIKGPGGLGGGADGSDGNDITGSPGAANTGGGGGGGGNSNSRGSSGGSGIVIIRYRIS